MKKIIFLFTILILSYLKTTSQNYPIVRMIRQNNFLYLNKMDFGIGQSQISFQLKLRGSMKSMKHIPQFFLGIAIDEDYDKLTNSQSCLQKQKYLKQIKNLSLAYDQKVNITFKIQQTVRQHIWYYYIFSCEQDLKLQKQNYGLTFFIQIISLNNGSHFGQDQKVIWIYFFALIISAALVPWNIKKLKKDLKQDQYDYAHIAITLAIVSLCVGYLYKFIHLMLYSQNGYGMNFLDVLFLISRTISQSIVVVLLVLIGWGWTINFIHSGNQDLYAPLGAMAAIINIVSTAIGKITDDSEDKHHIFDCVTGKIVLFFRVAMLVLFLVGIIKTYRQCRPKTKKFVIQFGILAFLYISIYPIAVLFCEMLLPHYMQNQVITGITQIIHAVANTLLTFMITSTKSNYTKLQYNPRTVFRTTVDGKLF